MNRRRDLSAIVVIVLLLGACVTIRRQGSGARPASVGDRRELTTEEQVQQVVSRLTFGARPGEAAAIRKLGIDNWIDRQLHPEQIEDSRAEQLLSRYQVVRGNRADLLATYLEQQQGKAQQLTPELQQILPELQSSLLTRAVASERQLQELMVNFWENHFSIYSDKTFPERIYLVEYDRDIIRPLALGKFRDLLGAVAKSPAMLLYLDNWESQADSLHPTLAEWLTAERLGHRAPTVARRRAGPNENYARELMELHTLGVDGGYTQSDVQEVARALTGWTMDAREGGDFSFRSDQHDAGPKLVLGHHLPAGRGLEDGEEVLDILARHPSTARYITTKLARYFISDDPPRTVLDRCSAVFEKTDGDIRSTVACIVTGPEFFSRAAYRAKVKTPFELVASAMRAMGATPDETPHAAQAVAQLGQTIFGHQTPEGWPDRAEAWLNSGAILSRINFGLQMASGHVSGMAFGSTAQIDALKAAPYDAQVNGVIELLLGGQASDATLRVLRGAESAGSKGNARLAGFQQVVGLAMGSPEFQRR